MTREAEITQHEHDASHSSGDDGAPDARLPAQQPGPESAGGASGFANASDAIQLERLLRRTREAHQLGRLNEAETGYAAVLELDADHADALHGAGILQFQRGAIERAEALLNRSVQLVPTPLSLSNYAGVLVSLGRRDEAMAHLEHALALNPSHLRARVQYADLLGEAGRHAEALSHYDSLLVEAQGAADVMGKRAAMLLALGQTQTALEACDRALDIDARCFAALVVQGNALRELGRYEEALTSFTRALNLIPQSVDVMIARGVTLASSGRTDDALRAFNEAVATSPGHIGALHNSAVALERLGHAEDALARSERVLAIDEKHVGALANRGNALLSLGRRPEALASYDEAMRHEPDNIEVLGNRARALQLLNRFAEALEMCARALELDSRFAPGWYAKGLAHQRLYEHTEALTSFDRAIELAPSDLPTWFMRGNTLRMLMRHDEAIEAYDRVLAVDPENVMSHFSKAFVYLAMGDFERGWPEYEWRWKEDQVGKSGRSFAQPLWLGDSPLKGKTILLHAEQGLGDTLQFVRYVERVKSLGAKVILEVQLPLKRLLERMTSADAVVSRGAPLPPFDLHCPLLSLGLAFGTDGVSIPATVPYLSPDSHRLQQWQSRLAARTRPRVGIVWSGNPKHLDDHNRSIPFSMWQPLLDDRFEWFSLQKVVRDEDQAHLDASGVRHFGDALEDFDDTAALVHEMDGVISVDTSVAHLAGALGRPLWVLLPYLPDWRWLLRGSSSAWYPSARLFRQPKPGDWQSVFDTMAQEIGGASWFM